MANRDQEQPLGRAKFFNCAGPLSGKGLDTQRILCACFLIQNMVSHLMTDPECRDVIQTAEDFANGKAERKELLKARKVARLWRHSGDWQGSDAESKRMANGLVYGVTWLPFGWGSLHSVAGNIANALGHAFMAANVKAQDALEVEDEAYKKMAGLVLTFLKRKDVAVSETPSLLDDPLLKKYHVLYLNPYIMRDWVVMNVKEKRVKRKLLAAIDCFFIVAVSPMFSLSGLAPIRVVARSEIRHHREMGVQLLLLLGMHHAAARDALYDLLSERSAEIRFTMLSHFGFYHLPCPKEFILKVVAKGLDDASAKVRRFAAEACFGYYEVNECLPLLTARLAKETNEKVKRGLEFNKDFHLFL